MQVLINNDFKNMLKQISDNSSKNEEENREFLNMQVSLRGEDFLGVLKEPLIYGNYESERYKEWCMGAEYSTADLLEIVKYFSILKFDNESDDVMDSELIDELHNWKVEELE